MKKYLLLLVFLCGCIGTTYAQKGESAIGFNLNYGDDTNLGLGIKYRYSFTDNWRIEPAFNYYFKHDYLSMWDLGANVHYLFPVAPQVSLYPLGGVSYSCATAHLASWGEGWHNVHDGNIGINLGGGVDFKVAPTVKLNLELKYQIVDSRNQLILSAGASFAF